ncbi:apolipoprotein N-acyltransferase [Sphingomonas jatrophae]|uniref:Apolipoprotein N-acyltransferase n=1 Tax=Sphingomonas jatrophae TaxID=1166337 RepID=A0A1I6JQ03_9SPHN|nr:apolipoprotein N-acyltransferase [Sphingomonas jatrophae]SFR81062.1 apolipoprotein N-acyltransferase [Sphingomonas jatrophae]
MILRLRPRHVRLLSLALGLVSATGFAPWHLWLATLLAVAGWMGFVRAAPRLRDAALVGWLFGLGQFVLGLNWIATAFTYQAAMPAWLGWVAVVLLSLYLAVYPMFAAMLAWRYRANGPAFILAFAAAWIATEWLRATMFTGFAWNPLGVIVMGTGALDLEVAGRLARLVGTYGLSGLILLWAGAALLATRHRLRLAAVLLVPLLLIRFVPWPSAPAAAPTAPELRIVQPKIGQQDKWDQAAQSANFARLAGLSRKVGTNPRLLLWPEAAVPDYLEEEPWARARLARLLGPRDLLLTGGSALVYDRTGKLVAARNSLFALDPQARLIGRYDKAHLVPYGEYLPMRPLLSAIGLSRLAPGDLDFLPGPGAQSIDLPGFGRVGVQICYEMIFSGRVVDAARRPSFLFNPSNDAWFGAWGPPQHLAQARLRAVEEGLPVVRATPTGISAVIDADGRLLDALPWRQAGVIDALLPPPLTPTLFARFGNALPLLLSLMLAVAAIACRRIRR